MKITAFLTIVTLLLAFPVRAPGFQDPVIPKKDNIYVEFITDCNWFVQGLEGKFKLHPQYNNAVGFRSWTPYLSHNYVTIKGFAIWSNVNFSQGTRDCIVFPWSSVKFEYPFDPGTVPFKWDFAVHYNKLNGMDIKNSETHMRVWGPCEVIRLYHGEAMIKHGDEIVYAKVDENDYVNFPPWEISLR